MPILGVDMKVIIAILALSSSMIYANTEFRTIEIEGRSAQVIVDKLYHLNLEQVNGVEYFTGSADTKRATYVEFNGNINISCVGSVRNSEAKCSLVINP